MPRNPLPDIHITSDTETGGRRTVARVETAGGTVEVFVPGWDPLKAAQKLRDALEEACMAARNRADILMREAVDRLDAQRKAKNAATGRPPDCYCCALSPGSLRAGDVCGACYRHLAEKETP